MLTPDGLFTRWLKFNTVGLIGIGVQLAALWLYVHAFGWHYLVAATVAFLVGAAVAYVLSIKYVFQFRRIDDRRAEFAGFAAIGAIGLAVNAGAMFAGVEWLGMHYLLAKVLAGGFTFALNYVLRRLALFTPPSPS